MNPITVDFSDPYFSILCSVENLKFLGDWLPKQENRAYFDSVSYTPFTGGSGWNATRLLRSQQIAPIRVVKHGSNEYRMFFLEMGWGGTYPSDFELDLLTSTDGNSWNPSNMTRNIVGASQTGQTFNYYAGETKEGGVYKLWQSATSDWSIAGTNVYYLTSTDGEHYSLQGMALPNGDFPAYDSSNVNHPWVVQVGGQHFLYYSAFPGQDYGAPDPGAYNTIGIAVSSDGGRTFAKRGNLDVGSGTAFDSAHAFSPVVIYDSSRGRFEMFYTGQDANGINRIGYATSPNGQNWTKQGSLDALGTGTFTVGAVKEGTTYRIWYTKDAGSGWQELWQATGAP